MTVLAGRLREEEKYVGAELAVMKEDRGFPVELGAAGDCVWVKVRRARGAAVRDRRAGREDRIRPEAVEAIRRVRDAIVWFAWWMTAPSCGSKLAVVGGRAAGLII